MRFLELFAGVGGFRYGLEAVSNRGFSGERLSGGCNLRHERACADIIGASGEQQQGFGFDCVWSNEWDKYAAAIYRYHWNDGTMHEGDIRAVDPARLPAHDLIVGGFPCQAFSIAGKRGGFADVRGTLFFEICRIAKACGTKYLFLENVKGLLNHKGGATFQTIISTLDELGYDCQWQVLNSRNYVPQNRERVFIIANLRSESRPQVFPIGQNCEPDIVLPALTTRYYGGQANGGYIGYGQAHRTPLKFMERNQKNIEGDYAFTIDSVNTGGVKVGSSIRRLTPTECERLQAFPDGWTKYGIFNGGTKEISDTQRYKTMGNAVTTAVITHIGRVFVCL